MPTKLNDIRTLVEGETSRLRYPITYRLVQDGETDISVLDKALTQDLLGGQVITLDDLLNDQILEESQMKSARLLGQQLMLRPGIRSAQRAVSYIQDMGRNSLVSQELNRSLRCPYSNHSPVTSGQVNL